MQHSVSQSMDGYLLEFELCGREKRKKRARRGRGSGQGGVDNRGHVPFDEDHNDVDASSNRLDPRHYDSN